MSSVCPTVRSLVLYRQPVDAAAFDRHYYDVHVPLAKRLPGLRRYAVSRNHRVVRGQESYYIVAEPDWDDMESFQADFQSPLGRENCPGHGEPGEAQPGRPEHGPGARGRV